MNRISLSVTFDGLPAKLSSPNANITCSKTGGVTDELDTYQGIPYTDDVMKFYFLQHIYYCGIDLHARKMYVCISDNQNNVKVHENIKTYPNLFTKSIDPGTAGYSI